MQFMTPAKPGQWETVGKAKADERKRKEADGKPKAGANNSAKGGKGAAAANGNSVFADFDRAFAAQAARERDAKAAAAAAQAAPAARFGGNFAHLAAAEDRQQQRRGGDSSDDEGSSSAKPAAPAPAKKPKAPKAPKKPRVGVAQAASSVDVGVVQEVIAALQQRYAGNEASQVEVMADSVAKLFKEAQVDFPKALATKSPTACAPIPYGDVPPPLANAIASFCSSVGEGAIAEVAVALMAALSEGLPTEAGGLARENAAARTQVGLVIMLAAMLRTRPGAIVLAAPQLLALGRALTAPGRLPLLLWALGQAAAAEPAAAVAAWVRVVLPQCTGAALPAPAPKGGAAAPAAATVPRMDAATQEAALQFLEGLLARVAAGGGGADVAVGGGRTEPVVPGAAVEAIARAAAPAAEGTVVVEGSGKAAKNAAAAAAAHAAAAEALAARLHAPLVTLAGASRVDGRQRGDWLVMVLETAGLSTAAPEAPDAVTDRAAASVAACLASPSGAAAFEVWEAKHKGQLRGSSRVLAALARRPELLRPLLANRARADALRQLLAALPSRHKSFLAAGKGWQGAAARSAEGSIAALRRRASGGWAGAFGGKGGGKGSGGGGGGAATAVTGLLAAAVAGVGVLAVAATYRLEVGGVVTHYAGRPAAEALDSSLLAPLNLALAPARAALAPHAAAAIEALAPHVAALRLKLAPLAAEVQKAAAPAAAAAAEAWGQLVAQAQEIYAKALQQQ